MKEFLEVLVILLIIVHFIILLKLRSIQSKFGQSKSWIKDFGVPHIDPNLVRSKGFQIDEQERQIRLYEKLLPAHYINFILILVLIFTRVITDTI